ncbi:MAG: adenylate/guanylate cyclase domain-containing protein [Thermoleophilia bacterium]|nr:adenylate/guanylate cyclase domain-containing protein [Thermoleophilia bacterium]MDH4339537.1 adenylate/guanylate cyclase domain-containing protein [Thermoleophilia bacterium]MDH5279746.1 adenylate/guanylate cyclase domain-containing protein [Thermoleophilia bacterium]
MTSPIRYARSGDVNVAYQVTGGGPFDLVLVPGFFSHLEIDWEHPEHARFLERFGSFARLIRFDKRGTGLSDRGVGLPDFETRMDDVRAVMDAAGSEQAALFGYSEGGPMSILFAATYPERTRALVVYGSYAKRLRSDDYPWAPTPEDRERAAIELEATWGENVDLSTMIPNADPAMVEWFQRRGRASLSPAAARDLIRMNARADVREALAAVQCPTLVLHRTGDLDSGIDEGRYIAERIPGARFVELPGDVHVPWVDPDSLLDEVEEFLTGTRPAAMSNRVLATVLFTDIVGSTDHLSKVGDAAWASLLDRHHQTVRHELERFGGVEVDTTGDGFVALFDGPARAIRSALSIHEALRSIGLDVRAGVHTGEVEQTSEGPRGIAVHLAARVLGTAGSGEIVVSQTTHDLVEGSGLEFDDRGEHDLNGIDGARRLYAVR